ncbi:hypothetical protein [Flavobacterium sp. PL002]|uniref:hypothetical protein n=1 Tax=Flavobacterium sp. PL002 TaxID=1897058 RepID=UPI001787D78D|nr:hypothetical protein [Flavobacterium sp. PL002]MBE0393752.1 hypothetical protein [Flavobacterium sp. PL002]
MNEKDTIVFKELEYGIKWYHYLIFLVPILFKPELYWSSIYGIIVLTFMRYVAFKAIDTKVDLDKIKHSNLIKSNQNIILKQIKSFKLIEFEVFFETKFLALYKYYNSNKISTIKYGIEIVLLNGKTIIIATRKPQELLTLIKKLNTTAV